MGTEVGGCCNDGRFGYLRADGTLAGSIGNDTGVVSTFDVRDTGWHHIAFVRDATGANIDLYIDGALDSSLVGGNTTTVTSNWAEIGRQIGGTQNAGRIVADIDELAIYNSALSASQIQAHFDAAFAAVPEPSTWTLFAIVSVFAMFGSRLWRKRGVK